jgi:hypothetical protein
MSCVSNGKIIEEETDSEGCKGNTTFSEVLFQHLVGRAKENHKNPKAENYHQKS